MIAYEDRLSRNVDWALLEGSMHFERQSAVYQALQRISRRLEELNIPYSLVGAMAMFFHGYRRFAETVDLLVNADGLKEIHNQLEGAGYLPPFAGSKQLRDMENGVRIEFLVTGAYPGDGKAKPIAFPDPEAAATTIDGIQCLQLPKLVELKLASGTSPGRLRDLGDVQDMIRVLSLTEDFAGQLHPSVQDLYKQLWADVQKGLSEP